MAKRSKKTVDKKLVLEYLQNNAWELRKQFDKVYDIRFEDEPARVIFTCLGEMEAPKLTYNGVDIPVEMEVKESGDLSIVEENSEDDEVYHRSITGKAAEVLHISEAQGPHSTEGSDSEAYKAWVKRHSTYKRIIKND